MMPSVVVVGAGRIGSGNEEGDWESDEPLNHVGAILKTTGLELVGIVDSSEQARAKIERRWRGRTRVPTFSSIDSLSIRPDIISICTPASQHEANIRQAVKLRPKLVIVEKPFSECLTQALELVRLCASQGVILRVNYNRRFDPATVRFRDNLGGVPAKVLLRYGKGLSNYASHLIDLLHYWFGGVHSVQAAPRRDLDAYADPNIDFRCRMAGGFDAIFVGIDDLQYDQCEIEIYYSDRCLSYLAGGAVHRIARSSPDLHYRGYAHLQERPELTWVGRVGGFRELYGSARDWLAGGSDMPGCDGLEAVAVHGVIEKVLISSRDGGREIRLEDGASLDL